VSELDAWTADALNALAAAGLEVAGGSHWATWAFPASPPRRQLPKKPCQWCVDRYAMPATHVAVWPREPVWDEDGPWMPPRRVRVCAFHGRFAQRYHGVRLYRFRKVNQ
jgi:hypothetical protein